VYVMQNEAIRDRVKIGVTAKLAEDRAQDLFRTGVPAPFEVAFRALTSDPKALEKLVHEQLRGRRPRLNREFFLISAEEAISVILEARHIVDGIGKWTGKTPLLHNGDRLILSMKKGQVFVIYAYPHPGAREADIVDIWQAHSDGDTLELYCTDSAEYTSGFSGNDRFSDQDPIPFLNRTGTANNDMVNGRERLVPGDRLFWMDDTVSNKIAGALFEMGCYCQVIARTRQPVFIDNSSPLLVNMLTKDGLSPKAINLGQYVLKMPPPRNWAPRKGGGEWVRAGEKEASGEFWLKQLEKRKRKS